MWKKLSPVLVFAMALDAALAVVAFVVAIGGDPPWATSTRYFVATNAAGLAASAIWAIGLFELAPGLGGRAALGVRVAAIAFALQAVASFAFEWVFALRPGAWGGTLAGIHHYTWFVLALVPAIGLAIAAWHRRGLAIAMLVVAFLGHPPRDLMAPLYGWLDLGGAGTWTLYALLQLVHIVAVIALAVVASQHRAENAPEPARATAGFLRAGNALWLRVIAAIAVFAITLLLVLGSAGRGAESVIKLAMISGAAISLLALVLFALGALDVARARVADVAVVPAAIAGTLSLWCAGVAAHQLPHLYQMLYGSRGYSGRGGDEILALSVVSPIVALVSTLAIAVAIGLLARRRGDEALGARASAAGGGYVVLTLLSLAIQVWMLPSVRSVSELALETIGLVACAFAGTVMMARLCGAAAAAIEREPGLPVAKVV